MASGLVKGAGTVPIKRLRCSKCRRPPVRLIEHGRWSTSWSLTDDGTERDDEGYHEAGDYTHVTAVCRCGHRWRIRGAIQITCIDRNPPPRGKETDQ